MSTYSVQVWQELINTNLNNCWMEESEAAEFFIMQHCNGKHYSRKILSIKKEKIIISTPLFNV